MARSCRSPFRKSAYDFSHPRNRVRKPTPSEKLPVEKYPATSALPALSMTMAFVPSFVAPPAECKLARIVPIASYLLCKLARMSLFPVRFGWEGEIWCVMIFAEDSCSGVCLVGYESKRPCVAQCFRPVNASGVHRSRRSSKRGLARLGLQ